MKTTRVWMGSVVLALLLAAGGRAAVVTGLYEASVPVLNQSAAARRVAMQQALAAVLVKITGERTAGGIPALAKLTQDPQQFLQQYRYEQAPTAGSSAPAVTYYDLTRTGAPAITPTGMLLSAKFDSSLVNQAVRGAQEPLWGEERPATLVWLAIDDAAGKNLLSSSGNPTVIQAMQSAAGQRGIPLIFPVMDLTDQQAIGFPDVAGNNVARIAAASQRYKPDATLVGSLTMTTGGAYAVHWQLSVGGESAAWNTPPGDLASVAADGVQTAADHYAQWFAIAPGATGMSGISVSVTDITNVQAYAKVLAYLAHLTPVKSAQVARVSGRTAYFTLDTEGSVANLRQAALLGGLLKSVAPGSASSVPAASLQFQYVQ